ncbi:MAG TPA: hypothetical protein VFX15_02800 [Actinomycetes bacterium]|nr:hypothetical protein [Actinomycetes bacterium]
MSFDWASRQNELGGHKHLAVDIIAEPEAGEAIVVYRKAIVLTNAQINALPTTPIEVIAAPGEGRILQVIGGVLSKHFVATHSNLDNAAIWALWYGSGSDVLDNYQMASSPWRFNGSSGDSYTSLGTPVFPGTGATDGYIIRQWSADATVAVNQPVALAIDNASAGDLTGGTSDTVTLTVHYTTVET